jgi:hypothetical protein
VIGGGSGGATLSIVASGFVSAFDANVNQNENVIDQPIPTSGTLSDFYVRLDDSPGISSSYTFTVRKNAVDTNLSCVIAGSGTSCSDTESADSVNFTSGDLLSIKVVPSVPPPVARAMRWTAKFAQ